MLVSLWVAAPRDRYFNKTNSIRLKCLPKKLLQFALTQFGETKPQVCLTNMSPAPREMKSQHTQQLSYPELDGKREPSGKPHAAYAKPGWPVAGMYKRAHLYILSTRIGH
jgi:hypothetical protein